MKGIVVAAGRGLRMRPYTDERPKCMLDIHGRSLLQYTLDGLRAAGCSDITIVTGHLEQMIRPPGCHLVHNADFLNNNILHSLMYARRIFSEALMVSYSDIYVEPSIYARLAAAPGDLVIAVDRDWQGYYEGRTGHPISEAEKVYVSPGPNSCGTVRKVGKHLDVSHCGDFLCGEFLGLWKMSDWGAKHFREHFEALERRLDPLSPFHDAREWRKAYITDFLSDLIASDAEVRCLLIERGWAELDAVQDYKRLPSIIQSQRLFSLAENTATMRR